MPNTIWSKTKRLKAIQAHRLEKQFTRTKPHGFQLQEFSPTSGETEEECQPRTIWKASYRTPHIRTLYHTPIFATTTNMHLTNFCPAHTPRQSKRPEKEQPKLQSSNGLPYQWRETHICHAARTGMRRIWWQAFDIRIWGASIAHTTNYLRNAPRTRKMSTKIAVSVTSPRRITVYPRSYDKESLDWTPRYSKSTNQGESPVCSRYCEPMGSCAAEKVQTACHKPKKRTVLPKHSGVRHVACSPIYLARATNTSWLSSILTRGTLSSTFWKHRMKWGIFYSSLAGERPTYTRITYRQCQRIHVKLNMYQINEVSSKTAVPYSP